MKWNEEQSDEETKEQKTKNENQGNTCTYVLSQNAGLLDSSHEALGVLCEGVVLDDGTTGKESAAEGAESGTNVWLSERRGVYNNKKRERSE